MARLFGQQNTQDKWAKAKRWFRPYGMVFLAFVSCVSLLKMVDTILLFSTHHLHFFQTLFPQIIYNLTISALYGLMIFPLFALLSLWKEKVALGVSIFLFTILLLAEVGFTIFTYSTGSLMQGEIFTRPPGEMLNAVSGVISLPVAFGLLLMMVAFFVFVALLFARKIHSDNLGVILFFCILLFPLALPATQKIEQSDRTPAAANYIINKSWYCLKSHLNNRIHSRAFYHEAMQKNGTISWNEELIDIYLQEFPNRKVFDKRYPLERANDGTDVLSPYFQPICTTPNVVFLVVESLGREWSGENPSGVSFTPFIDSLAYTGLYWKNCLSTTPRSFGAVPAITGSLPYGPKGFQFGRMPRHQSIFSILQSADFQTNVYTACDLNFDCVSDYLMEEHVDFIAPYYFESKKLPKGKQRGWWGFYDHQMFEMSVKDLNSKPYQRPLCNLFITITSHDDLDLGDANLEQKYFRRVEEISKRMNPAAKKEYTPYAKRQAAMLYVDDCVRDFFFQYSKRPDFQNTIFIITGDHSTGMNKKNTLSSYHVPLVVWSPLLKRSGQFPNIVSHIDIVPSLCKLLENTYGIPMPDKVHWIGDGLDTSSVFHPTLKMTLLDYGRILNLLVYNEYFLSEWNDVYRMDENLNFTYVTDEALKKKLLRVAKAVQYMHNYVYLDDRLTSRHPQYKEQKNSLFTTVHAAEVACVSPSQPPSKVGPKRCYFVRGKMIPLPQKNQYVDVHFVSEVFLPDSLWIDQNASLVIQFADAAEENVSEFKEVVTKFITDGKSVAGRWHFVDITKRFDVHSAKFLRCSIFVTSPEVDNYWRRGGVTKFRNTRIEVSNLIEKKQNTQ